MPQYRLPTRRLVVAFVLVYTVVMVTVILLYQYTDVTTAGLIAVKVIGTSAIVFTLWEWFRRRLWKRRIFRTLGLVDFPDINGSWEGTVLYDGEDEVMAIPGEAKITQTYTTISLTYTGLISDSDTISASFARSGDEFSGFLLVITFQNMTRKKLTAHQINKGLQEHGNHRGTVCLRIQGDTPDTMEGRIWSDNLTIDKDKPHPTYGFAKLTRQK